MDTEDEVVENEEQEQIPPNPIEEKARSQGWVPKDDWKGDPDSWRSAKEFVERGELLESISSLKRAYSTTKQDLKAIAEHHAKYVERENARIEAALKAQKVQALKDQDFQAVVDIDEELKAIKEAPPITVDNSDPRGEQKEEFQKFTSANPWYNSDEDMTEYADSVGTGYALRNPNKTYSEVYEYVKKQVHKAFPEKFNRDVNGSRVTTTTNTTNRSSANKAPKYTEADLTREQKDIGRRFVESGAIKNLQEYVDQLASIDGINK